MSVPKVKLYMTYTSQPCRAIGLYLKLKGIPFDMQVIDVGPDTNSAWYRKMNPMGLVPVLEHGNLHLTESDVIVKYLASFSAPDHWYPEDRLQRALVDEFLSWRHAGVRRACVALFLGRMMDRDGEDRKIRDVERQLNFMENYFLKRGDYITGSDITVADIFAICELMQPLSIGYPVDRNRPRMQKWMDRVKARLQPHFDELHEEILEFGAMRHKSNWGVGKSKL